MKTTEGLKMLRTNYKTLCETVDEILVKRGAKQNMLTFSIFEDLDNGDEFHNDEPKNWIINAPDLYQSLDSGKVRIIDSHTGFKSKTLTDPTWEDVVYWANESILWGMKKHGIDGWDHVFLESVEFKEEKNGVKIYDMWFGS